ncbi:type IV secretion system protein TraC [Vibrio genomosp. F6]|uniref:Type-IV secretion system protein TraC n=1 Tax=Vibrio genomosp. F6 str. FF-238 TaxID=1191298 RepID=A0A1E5CSG5_9VIBR|nr:type IV secretion system protein TraC [Vibrio genomosp. F6]OEE72840.1 type-IV secretion system protein TraC [Vibrio genomosp. F6 str. FF-238]
MKTITKNVNGLIDVFKEAKKQQNHLHAELPYRTFDFMEKVFDNKRSKGFGLQISVLGGANDELVQSLNKLVGSLPQGDQWDYQLALFGHNKVAHYIEANEALMSERGGICQQMARDEAIYAKFAAHHGFFHRQKNHFDLRDYDAYFFVSTSNGDPELINDIRAMVETSLTQLGFDLRSVTPEMLLTFVGDVLNFDKKQDRPIIRHYNPFDPLHLQALSPDTELLTHRNHLSFRHTSATGKEVQSRTVSMGLARLPGDFRLYGLPECFSSLRNVSRSLTCPHLLTLNFRSEVTGKQQADNDKKIADLTKTVESKMALLMPTAGEELEERKNLQKGMNDKEFTLSSMVMNLTLFTDKENQRRDTESAKNAFSAGGIDIIPLKMLQAQSLLVSLPFMMSEGFWKDCKKAGRVRTLKSSNLVNFFPIVMDFKQLKGGMLLPTMRQQISFFNPFTCGSDNKNIALTGGSGAGKSFFVEELAKCTHALGGKVWILDKGSSYKKLTMMLNGTYMDAKNIYLNPFTHLGGINNANTEFVDDDGNTVDPMMEALDNITALFATIASPYQSLTPYQLNVLGDAIMTAWNKKQTETLVDDVQAELFALADAHDDRRIRDIGVQLNKYCKDSIYGDTFNKPSMLDPNIHFTTLELDGFPPAVLRPVIFALIVSINQQMYLSGSRSTPKMCIIEEAWSLLSGSNEQAREFINAGYRTARKFGGSFCTVTQGIEDFFSTEEAKASYNNSDIHITLRQGEGFDTFLTENPNAFSPYEQRIIKNFDKSSTAGYSCARIKAGGHVTYHRFFADPVKRAMLSTEPHEFEYCENLVNQGMPLSDAIDQTSMHFYGDEIREFKEKLQQQNVA